MRFNYLHCQKATISISNAGIEESMNWLLSQMDDPGSRLMGLVSPMGPLPSVVIMLLISTKMGDG
ncbi:Ubiquitinyl hydrolase 1 [Bertholletia excelsa]